MAPHLIAVLGRRLPSTIREPIRARRQEVRRREAKRRFLEAVAAAGDDLRIHVGAGPVRLPDWLNTDIDGSAELYLDATRPWPVQPGSVSYVYGDNFIEHLTLDDARRFLAYARTALRPGGLTLDAMLERHRRNGYRVEYAVDVLRIAFAESEHWRGYLYDETALSSELQRAGYVDFQVCHVGESTHPALRGLDSRDEPVEDALQLVLEAARPVSQSTQSSDE